MLPRLSAIWARAELAAASFMAITITLLILLNVFSRSMGAALYWVDELAIYVMAWMAFLGASAGLHYGHAVAITVLTDVLPVSIRRIVAKMVDLVVLAFALLMVWFSWRWYAPMDLIRHNFDVLAFQADTFNFIYSEPTTTLGIKKAWVWSVMWVFAFGATLHSLANLLDRPAVDDTEVAA